MDNKVLYFKVIISIVLFVTGFILYFLIKKINIQGNKLKALLFLILCFSRLLIFFVVFVILGLEPQSDLPSYYYPQAKNVLNGLLPYKDFITSYSPLFPYFTTIPLLILDSVKSIVFFSIIIEFLSVMIWYRVTIENLDEQISNKILLIYSFNPIPIILVAINGQNQIWMSLFIALTFYLFIKERYYLAGFCFALGFLVTKFLFLIFLLPILFFHKNIKKFLSGFLPSIIIIYSILILYRIDFLMPIKIEGNDFTSGNIVYLISLFWPSLLTHSFVLNLFLLAIIFYFLIYIKRNNIITVKLSEDIISLITLSSLVFVLILLLSKKSYTNYLTIMLYPIIIGFISVNNFKKYFVFFSLFGSISVLEPSLWFRIMHQNTLDIIFKPFLMKVNSIYGIFFICIEILLICFYITIFRTLYLKLKKLVIT